MFGLGTQELIVILIVAFFIFGAKRLPEIGRDLGKGIRSFKKGLNDIEEDSKGLLSEQTDNKIKQDVTAAGDKNPLEKAVGDLPGVKEAREVKESIDKLKA